jgi:hypothetical protein
MQTVWLPERYIRPVRGSEWREDQLPAVSTHTTSFERQHSWPEVLFLFSLYAIRSHRSYGIVQQNR